MEKNIIFKKENDRYKLFFIEGRQELDMGVSFITDHNIEDYPISVTEFIDGQICHYKPCKNVVVKLLNPPHLTKHIEISKDANLDFNENTLLGSSVPHSPDGFRRVYIDYFDLSHNYNVDVVFKDPASTAPVKELEEKDIPSNIFEGFIHENKNINFTVLANRGLLAFMNNTYAPMRENNYQRLDVISNADHFGFAFNNIALKSTKEFIDKKRPAELNFNAEAVIWSETKLDVLGVNTITLKSPSSSKPAILKGSKVEGFFSDADLELIGKKAKITGSSKVSLNLFGSSSLKANGNIAIEAKVENTSLYKAKVENKNGPLNIFDSKLESVNAEFNMKKGIVASIKDSRIKASTITNQNGNIVKSNFANTIMENCTFAEGSTLELAKKTDIKYMSDGKSCNEIENINYTLKNVELKEKSSIKTVFEAEWREGVDYKPRGERHVSINNVIATGSNSIQRLAPTSINNSILNNVLVFNYHPDVAINNSILGGSISLTNITSVESSDLCHAVIDASTPVKMEDESVSYKNIKDYAKHIANKDKAIEDAETKDSIVTQALEIL